MTTDNLVSVRADFNRNHHDQPLILPPTGGKPIAYKRVTRYISVLEDLYMLQQWEKRMVALGLADRADLLLAVAAHRDDKGRLNRICDQAKDAARGSAAATTGTALHALTDVLDSGGDLPALPAGPAASLAAFREATAPLKVVAIEQKLVLDTHRAAGTADRIYEVDGQRYIGDTKSGNIELGILKIAMQLAIYARSHTYDVTTGERGVHGASTNRAIVMHMPATDDPKAARCDLLWVDIETGWEAVKVARRIWDMRKLKMDDLTAPFGQVPRPSLRLQKRDEQLEADLTASVIAQIKATTTLPELRALWRADWPVNLSAAALDHAHTLPQEEEAS
jgi:hypothetical protein